MILSTKFSLAVLSCLSAASAQYHAITGVQDGIGLNGSRPARQNIYTLQKDPYAWPLYIQALTALQSLPNTTLTSYFQISGIHGRPYITWDNVDGQYPYSGYCTHDSVLFPTWHRPFLALFEQELILKAKEIALQYNGNDKANYQSAAKRLRIPYWDWAASAAIPTILTTAKITISNPGGNQVVDNPLYAYQFPNLDPTYFPMSAPDGFLANESTTIRDPNASYNLQKAGLTTAIYNLFSRITDYDTFATQSVSGSSLEAVHGTVHVDVGGEYGHMSYLSYAGFDPIFWLHHCNVDRIFALWQATHPQTFVPDVVLNDAYGTFTIGPNTQEYSSTTLTPFSSDATGDLYTSDTSRYMKTFGYTYPEIQDWNQNPTQLAQTVTAKVNELYAPKSATHRKRHLRDISTRTDKVQEWFANIVIDKDDLRKIGSALILLFMGDPPTDPSTYRGASNLVSFIAAFIPPNSSGANLSKAYGELSLQDALEKVPLPDYSEATVVAYLTANLQWKVQTVDGQVVDLYNCPSLQIKVQSDEITQPDDVYGFPSYGNTKEYLEITRGKTGGAS